MTSNYSSKQYDCNVYGLPPACLKKWEKKIWWHVQGDQNGAVSLWWARDGAVPASPGNKKKWKRIIIAQSVVILDETQMKQFRRPIGKSLFRPRNMFTSLLGSSYWTRGDAIFRGRGDHPKYLLLGYRIGPKWKERGPEWLEHYWETKISRNDQIKSPFK